MNKEVEKQVQELQIKILNATQRGEMREAKYYAKELKKVTEKQKSKKETPSKDS